jgi:excisionase family DNA binding protein
MNNNEPISILSLEDVCKQLTLGKNAVYNLIRTGQIKAFRIKRIWKIPQSSVNEYVQKMINNNL